MARPSKYTVERGQAILALLRTGATRKASAETGGVSYRTFLDWVQKGEAATSGHLHEFAAAVEEAEAQIEARFAKVLQEAAEGYDASVTTRTTRTETFPDGRTAKVTTETSETRYVRDWKAAESWLKRRRRDDWGDNSANTHSAPGGGPVLIREVIVEMTPDDPDEAEAGAAEPLAG